MKYEIQYVDSPSIPRFEWENKDNWSHEDVIQVLPSYFPEKTIVWWTNKGNKPTPFILGTKKTLVTPFWGSFLSYNEKNKTRITDEKQALKFLFALSRKDRLEFGKYFLPKQFSNKFWEKINSLDENLKFSNSLLSSEDVTINSQVDYIGNPLITSLLYKLDEKAAIITTTYPNFRNYKTITVSTDYIVSIRLLFLLQAGTRVPYDYWKTMIAFRDDFYPSSQTRAEAELLSFTNNIHLSLTNYDIFSYFYTNKKTW